MGMKFNDLILKFYFKGNQQFQKHQRVLVFILGIGLMLFSLEQAAYAGGSGAGSGFDGDKYGRICSAVLALFEGQFGAMVAASAGLGAIIASAMGGFKMAWSLIVVSVGSFILREYQEMWFNECPR